MLPKSHKKPKQEAVVQIMYVHENASDHRFADMYDICLSVNKTCVTLKHFSYNLAILWAFIIARVSWLLLLLLLVYGEV